MSGYRPINDPIARHARPLIGWLEEKIEKDFGVKVLIGCEKECFLQFYTLPSRLYPSPEDKREAVVEEWKAALERLGVTLRRSAIRGPVGRFYEEAGNDQFEFTTTPTSPLRALHRLDAQCQLLERYASTHRDINNETALKNVNYLPYRETEFNPVTAGLHVNFSLWKGNRNVMRPPAGDRKPLTILERIWQALRDYEKYDSVLIAPSHAAQQRKFHEGDLLPRFDRPGSGLIQSHEYDGHRGEFRAPSADARHDLALLMVLTAIWRGLAGGTYEREHGSPLPGGLPEAIECFEKDSRLLPDLRQITQEDAIMLSHVKELRGEVLAAAQEQRLTQPVFLGQHPSRAVGSSP